MCVSVILLIEFLFQITSWASPELGKSLADIELFSSVAGCFVESSIPLKVRSFSKLNTLLSSISVRKAWLIIFVRTKAWSISFSVLIVIDNDSFPVLYESLAPIFSK